jgi:hypothetical protein
MKLADLDEARMLANHREAALRLKKAAPSGTIDCTIWRNGAKHDPFSIISADIVRTAIVNGCNDFIAKTDARLAEIGIEPNPDVSEGDPSP